MFNRLGLQCRRGQRCVAVGESTTSDVVRQAIIPLTADHAVAYATKVAEGKPRLATKMVTHNWGNRFSHLMAAIFADCLGRRTYEAVYELLQSVEGVQDLRVKLATKLHKTYWVCAFCVNQHVGICNQVDPVDSTGAQITACPCKKQKCLTGADCEMNKFDDMMAYLKATVPGFSQVVAVDSELVLFSRIWCMAELLEASASRLPQALKLESSVRIERFRGKIESFDVRDAQASFPGDRDFVLSKIKDKDAFNQEIKRLILDPSTGLLAAWLGGSALGTFGATAVDEGMNVLVNMGM